MSITLSDVNYNQDFICSLLKEVNDKIALVANKDYKNQVYDLQLKGSPSQYTDLIEMSGILERILACNSCYENANIKIEDVISIAKNLINK